MLSQTQSFMWFSRPYTLLEQSAADFGDRFTLQVPGWGTPAVVVVHDPAAVREVFTAADDALAAGLANAYLRPLFGERSLFVLDGAEHIRLRRLLLRALSGPRLQTHGRSIQEIARRSSARWPRDRPFPLLPALLAIALDVIIDVVLGASPDPRHHHAIRTQVTHVVAQLHHSLAAAGGPAQNVATQQVRHNAERLAQLLNQERAARRISGCLAGGDVFQTLLGTCAGWPDAEAAAWLRAQLMTLLFAGHETTGTALAWTLVLLAEHPDAMDRLRAELAELGTDPDPEAVVKLPWLDAVIRESLRFRPVVPVVSRQTRCPVVLAGMNLTAGIRVSPSIYLAQRRCPPFDEPEMFSPERFLSGRRASPYEFFPFGGGQHRCTGMGLALYEMKLVLAELVERFGFTSAATHPVVPTRRTIIVAPSQGAPFALTRRRRPSA
ncbi:MAG TPA: cytochrome P450 [Pseudonocardiaceae bacterium]|nr:cytochrome P450 [Pseudonocardiaceae bacterium]